MDSHIVVWWLEDNQSLGSQCRELIADADEAYFSAVTPWELGIKRSLGKLTMPEGLSDVLESEGFKSLSITAAHAELAPSLPPHHRDPFDRMLVAQAQLETLVLVTADNTLAGYDIEQFDART
ncbi:MAG: type II toxin-antitoxin system VapC family toxin [Acidimicrobiia bacterium]|nr:type II toxin-antitoxin system VapC family toxin [Acidimicrobiia bacterium]